jgi:hypothetical protein
MQTNILILRDKTEYEYLMRGSQRRLQRAHFACYGEGNHFVIVKDRFGDRIGASITSPMLTNILAQM